MYYVRIRGKVFGPLEEKQVVNLVRQGKLGRMNEISTDQRQWVRADEFEQFFPKPQPKRKTPVFEANGLQKDMTQVISQPSEAESLANAWYYSEDGKTGSGPFPQSDIEQMIRQDKIIGETILWNDRTDPQTAETIAEFSRFFRKTAKPAARRNRNGSPFHQVSDDGHGLRGTLSQELTEQLEKSATWSLVLALMATAGAAVFVVAQLFLFVLIVQTGSVPLTLGFLLVVPVTDMVSGYVIYALWRYLSQLKRTLRMADDASLTRTAKRMTEFWRTCVLAPIVLCVFLLLVLLLAFTVGLNTLKSSYNDMMRQLHGELSTVLPEIPSDLILPEH
jgi:hypothetical protein